MFKLALSICAAVVLMGYVIGTMLADLIYRATLPF